jgi:hypothetical protein
MTGMKRRGRALSVPIMPNTCRTIIQDRQSRLYFKQPDAWTADIGEATNFERMTAAIEFARQTGRQTLDVLMTFGDPKYDVRISASS